MIQLSEQEFTISDDSFEVIIIRGSAIWFVGCGGRVVCVGCGEVVKFRYRHLAAIADSMVRLQVFKNMVLCYVMCASPCLIMMRCQSHGIQAVGFSRFKIVITRYLGMFVDEIKIVRIVT